MRGLGDWPRTLTRPLILTFSAHAGRRRRPAVARKIWRKSLKRLNPRPETPSPRFGGERVGVRGLGIGRTSALARKTGRRALKTLKSAPGEDWLDEAGSGSLPNPLVPYPIGPGRFPMTLNGVRAC